MNYIEMSPKEAQEMNHQGYVLRLKGDSDNKHKHREQASIMGKRIYEVIGRW